MRMLEENAIELPNGRSKHLGEFFCRVRLSQFLSHNFHCLFDAPVSTFLQILIRQPPDLMCRTMLVDHKGSQPFHSARPAAMFDQDLNGQIYCRSSTGARQDATVTDIKLIFDRHGFWEHCHEFRSVMGVDCGAFSIKETGHGNCKAACAQPDKCYSFSILLFDEFECFRADLMQLVDQPTDDYQVVVFTCILVEFPRGDREARARSDGGKVC